MADGLRSALPGVAGARGRRARPRPGRGPGRRRPTWPWSWSGYTRLDEGEYIGEFATAHLAHLFPGRGRPGPGRAVHRARSPTSGRSSPPTTRRPSAADGGFADGGDRRSLRLHDRDVDLIRAVTAANPRTVVAMVAGSAVVISEWDSRVPAIVQSWYSGMEGGHGLADVLLGSRRCLRTAPVLDPDDGVRPPRLRRRCRRVRLRRLARLLAPRLARAPVPPTRSGSGSATRRSTSSRRRPRPTAPASEIRAIGEELGSPAPAPTSSRSTSVGWPPTRPSDPSGWPASPGSSSSRGRPPPSSAPSPPTPWPSGTSTSTPWSSVPAPIWCGWPGAHPMTGSACRWPSVMPTSSARRS